MARIQNIPSLQVTMYCDTCITCTCTNVLIFCIHVHYNPSGNGSPSCSPVKSSGACKFKRSLSFGGLSTSTPRNICSVNTPGNNRQSTVVARPCKTSICVL